jgi:hypothetical protein
MTVERREELQNRRKPRLFVSTTRHFQSDVSHCSAALIPENGAHFRNSNEWESGVRRDLYSLLGY